MALTCGAGRLDGGRRRLRGRLQGDDVGGARGNGRGGVSDFLDGRGLNRGFAAAVLFGVEGFETAEEPALGRLLHAGDGFLGAAALVAILVEGGAHQDAIVAINFGVGAAGILAQLAFGALGGEGYLIADEAHLDAAEAADAPGGAGELLDQKFLSGAGGSVLGVEIGGDAGDFVR
ncbi:MAG: hypothetical protein ABI165_18385, partial [Bryobacteraceae bacterium]